MCSLFHLLHSQHSPPKKRHSRRALQLREQVSLLLGIQLSASSAIQPGSGRIPAIQISRFLRCQPAFLEVLGERQLLVQGKEISPATWIRRLRHDRVGIALQQAGCIVGGLPQ